MTATDPREGKPLKTAEPHGRYRVKIPERSEEEQVAGAVENGVSGTTAGGGKPVPVDSPDSKRRRGRNPRRGVPGSGSASWRGSGPAWKRVTEEATNLKRDDKTTIELSMVVVERAKTPRVDVERRKTEGGEMKANEVSSALREALKRR